MKKFRTILVWITISLLFQCGVFLFLDKFYFKDNAKVNMEQVKIIEDISNNQNHPYIPKEATEIKPSYDGKYLSYKIGEELNVLDSNTGEIKNFELVKSGDVLDYLWLSDRNVLLTLENSNGSIGLYSYNAKKNENEKIIDVTYYSPNYLTFDIKSSPITGVTYVRIGNSIFRIDINQSHPETVPVAVRRVGSMEVIPTKDRLVYIAEGGNIIHITQPYEKESVNGYGPLEIMHIDESDNLYLCSSIEDGINKIIKKNINSKNSPAEVLYLDEIIDKENIFIKNDGRIFINYSSLNEVKEFGTENIYKYEGNFIGIYQKGIASEKENKLYRISI